MMGLILGTTSTWLEVVGPQATSVDQQHLPMLLEGNMIAPGCVSVGGTCVRCVDALGVGGTWDTPVLQLQISANTFMMQHIGTFSQEKLCSEMHDYNSRA